MTDERSPEDRLHGVLRIVVGGVEKRVPTLPIRPAMEWWETYGVPKVVQPGSGERSQPERMGELNRMAIELELDLMVAYDRTGALGGREWLETNATPAEIDAGVKLMIANVFPFADSAGEILLALVAATTVRSRLLSSTSGPSRPGASTRRRSKSVSTRRS